MQDQVQRVGAADPAVKDFRALRRAAGGRDRRAAIEGVWALRQALAAGVTVEVVFVCEEMLRGDEAYELLERARAQGAAVSGVGPRVLLRMVSRDGPDGVAAIVHIPRHRLSDLHVGSRSRLVVVDSIEMAGNAGTIIRCADGAGADAVILTDSRIRITHPLVVKASMGTVFVTPIVETTADEAIDWLVGMGIRAVAADPSANTPYRDVEYAGPVALVFGSERRGLKESWRCAVDSLVSIPMLGVADSLNIGHAVALLLYEALHRQGSQS